MTNPTDGHSAAPMDLDDEAKVTPAQSLGTCRATIGSMLFWMAVILVLAALLCG